MQPFKPFLAVADGLDLKIVTATDGKLVVKATVEKTSIGAVAFAADGSRVAVGGLLDEGEAGGGAISDIKGSLSFWKFAPGGAK